MKRIKKKSGIFIHIPKNAGTSVTTLLLRNGGKKLKYLPLIKKFKNEGLVTFGHINIKSLVDQNIITQNYYDETFKFCFSRNPYNRLVSIYLYLYQNKYSFEEFIIRIPKMEILKPGLFSNHQKNSFLNPQVRWIPDDINFIGSVENINNDMEYITKMTGIEFKKIPIKNISSNNTKKPYQNY